jgi:hypothetical protein
MQAKKLLGNVPLTYLYVTIGAESRQTSRFSVVLLHYIVTLWRCQVSWRREGNELQAQQFLCRHGNTTKEHLKITFHSLLRLVWALRPF